MKTSCVHGHDVSVLGRTSNGTCRQCVNTRSSKWQKLNKDKALTAYRKHYDKQKKRLDALKAGPCTDCGGIFPAVCMDWDHHENKVFNLSRGRNLAWHRVLQELKKCTLVCANCHRIRSAQRTMMDR